MQSLQSESLAFIGDSKFFVLFLTNILVKFFRFHIFLMSYALLLFSTVTSVRLSKDCKNVFSVSQGKLETLLLEK